MGMGNAPLELTYELPDLAPCEHYAGNEKFIRKALVLQGRHVSPQGKSLVDLTLDLEDGAPVGQEQQLRELFVSVLNSPDNAFKQVGVRVHPPHSEQIAKDLEVIVEQAGHAVSYITIPKVSSVRDVLWIAGVIRHHRAKAGIARAIPLHLLIETPEAVAALPALAAIASVETLDFGLMDFISHLSGAISADCMKSPGQFEHALISSVKTQIALAALGASKIPNHNVTVDVRDPETAFNDAYRARHEFGYLRMWSIHPEQVDSIIRGMTPSREEIDEAKAIMTAAQNAQWGPIQVDGRLHDRASYRYYWGILKRSGETCFS